VAVAVATGIIIIRLAAVAAVEVLTQVVVMEDQTLPLALARLEEPIPVAAVAAVARIQPVVPVATEAAVSSWSLIRNNRLKSLNIKRHTYGPLY